MGFAADLRTRGLLYQWSSDALDSLLEESSISAYVGFDPTADSLHVGSLLQILNMRRLQLGGHKPVFVAGGGTGMIGDPSGKSEERNLLSQEQLDHNLQGVSHQLARFVDFEGSSGQSAVILDNREWLAELNLIEFLRDVGKHFNVNQMIQKDSVRSRIGAEGGFSYTEFSYMLLQAYDFYHLFKSPYHVQLQLGGSDQWGNITAGIDYVRKSTGSTVYGITSPLVTRADGRKFGKTEGGAVWLDGTRTSPFSFYQFFMRSDDAMVGTYLRYFTFLDTKEIDEIESLSSLHPEKRYGQQRLSFEVTAIVHSPEEARRCQEASEVLYSGGVASSGKETLELAFSESEQLSITRSEVVSGGLGAVELLARSSLCSSRGEARRVLSQGGLYLNGERLGEDKLISEEDLLFGTLLILRKGKRDYCLVRAEL